MEPESPVDGDVEHKVEIVARLEVKALEIVDRRDNEPRREDAQQAAFVKATERGLFQPGIPQSYAAKEEKHIHPDIATAT